MKTFEIVVSVLLILAAWKILGNVHARETPPAACELLGGNWSIWSGWSCG